MSMKSHQEINKEMKLFDTFEEAGAGNIFWYPNGYAIYDTLKYWLTQIHQKEGYRIVRTPIIYRSHLWKISGHYDMYKDFMYFFNVEDEEYGIKPMNCPAHILIYKSEVHSYKELPIKLFEFGFVHRHELSGVLNGLFRVRSFTQDDAHIFLRKDQIEEEVKKVLSLIQRIFDSFDMKDRHFYLSTMPDKHLGKEEAWREVESMLESALKGAGIKYGIKQGDGAFYGPKIDVEVKDSLGREWQLSTIQLDFNLPERFDVTYVNDRGEKERVYMLHRAILGSLERFIGILIEHYQGKFPTWIAPVQLRLIPVSEEQNAKVLEIKEELIKRYPLARIEIDLSSNTLNKKIRNAEIEKVAIIGVVGKREDQNHEITLRIQNNQNTVSLEEFYTYFGNEIDASSK